MYVLMSKTSDPNNQDAFNHDIPEEFNKVHAIDGFIFLIFLWLCHNKLCRPYFVHSSKRLHNERVKMHIYLVLHTYAKLQWVFWFLNNHNLRSLLATGRKTSAQRCNLPVLCPLDSLQCTVINPSDKKLTNLSSVQWPKNWWKPETILLTPPWTWTILHPTRATNFF